MRMFLVLVVGFLFVADISGSDRRGRRNYRPVQNFTQKEAVRENLPEKAEKIGEVCEDALDEVNKKRADLGLKPFIKDKLLTEGALNCAKERAKFGIHGHLSSDFDWLPSGANATAAGCGALEPSWGWGTCCYTENYTYAGAAWVMGNDGRRYMHIFVR